MKTLAARWWSGATPKKNAPDRPVRLVTSIGRCRTAVVAQADGERSVCEETDGCAEAPSVVGGVWS